MEDFQVFWFKNVLTLYKWLYDTHYQVNLRCAQRYEYKFFYCPLLYALINFSYICYLVYIAFGIFVIHVPYAAHKSYENNNITSFINNNCPMKLYAFRSIVINSQNSTYAPQCTGLCQPMHSSSVPMDENYSNQVWSKPLASSFFFLSFF